MLSAVVRFRIAPDASGEVPTLASSTGITLVFSPSPASVGFLCNTPPRGRPNRVGQYRDQIAYRLVRIDERVLTPVAQSMRNPDVLTVVG